MKYQIKNYIKLLCLRVDHFESFVVDEINTTDSKEIEDFVNLYQGRDGLKILMIQMANMEMVTFDQIKKVIQNAHVFDYIRRLASQGHELIPIEDNEKLDMSMYLKILSEIPLALADEMNGEM